MEDVKKHVAALFNSRFSKRYLPRKKRPPFKGVISLDFLDRPLDTEDKLQENEYIPLNILEKQISVPKDEKKGKDVQHDTLDKVSSGISDKEIIPLSFLDSHVDFSGRSSDHISLDILDRIIYSQNYSPREKKNDNYISLDILDKKPRKEKCEHLSPVMECFAGGFGHIRCFDQDFHENCRFKLNHKKMLEERMQIRRDMKKFG